MTEFSTWKVDGIRGLCVHRVYVRAHSREEAVSQARYLFRLQWILRASQERR